MADSIAVPGSRADRAGLRIELLADHPDAVAVVARWYCEQWHGGSADDALARITAEVAASASRHAPPLQLLAVEAGRYVGAAGLVIREMKIFPDREFWLGGVYVAAPHRGRGIAARLVDEALRRARMAGIGPLWLQTERLDGGLYPRHGFVPVQQVFAEGREVLVMVAELGA